MVKTRGKEYPGMKTEGGNLQGGFKVIQTRMGRVGRPSTGLGRRRFCTPARDYKNKARDIWAVWSYNFPPPENNPFSESRFQMGNLNLKNKIVIFSNRKK